MTDMLLVQMEPFLFFFLLSSFEVPSFHSSIFISYCCLLFWPPPRSLCCLYLTIYFPLKSTMRSRLATIRPRLWWRGVRDNMVTINHHTKISIFTSAVSLSQTNTASLWMTLSSMSGWWMMDSPKTRGKLVEGGTCRSWRISGLSCGQSTGEHLAFFVVVPRCITKYIHAIISKRFVLFFFLLFFFGVTLTASLSHPLDDWLTPCYLICYVRPTGVFVLGSSPRGCWLHTSNPGWWRSTRR